MIIAVPTETSPGETRVAATPDTVKKYFSRGLRIRVQSGAGLASGFADEAYRSAGAEIMQTAAETINDAAVVIKIKSPLPEEISLFRNGQILIGDMEALSHPAHIKELSEKGLLSLVNFSIKFFTSIASCTRHKTSLSYSSGLPVFLYSSR